MEISVEWHDGQYPSFNVHLHGKPGADPFLTVKGCKIVQGSKGDFVSYPSRKQDNGKYWNHVYGSLDFNDAVLTKALAARPRQSMAPPPRRAAPPTRNSYQDARDDDRPPF